MAALGKFARDTELCGGVRHTGGKVPSGGTRTGLRRLKLSVSLNYAQIAVTNPGILLKMTCVVGIKLVLYLLLLPNLLPRDT